jgi:hypothetical protein
MSRKINVSIKLCYTCVNGSGSEHVSKLMSQNYMSHNTCWEILRISLTCPGIPHVGICNMSRNPTCRDLQHVQESDMSEFTTCPGIRHVGIHNMSRNPTCQIDLLNNITQSKSENHNFGTAFVVSQILCQNPGKST